MEFIGTTIKNKYRVLSLIDSGGMGHVYRGELVGAMQFSRPVAIKTLRAIWADNEPSRDLFVREAQACARLQHRNIVTVLDFERTDNGHLVMVMEYIDGLDLGTLAQTHPWASIPACVYTTIEVLHALAHAHDREVIHRDVKPRNILIARTGEIKLTDFGMSKVADQSSIDLIPGKKPIKGTIGYLSPEAVRHEPMSARTDLFSVGVTLYGLLTGHLPFGKSGIAATTARMFKDEMLEPKRLRPDIPDPLNTVVMRLLREDPAERYPCAREAIDALAACDVGHFTIDDMAALVDDHLTRRDRARTEREADPDATQRHDYVPSTNATMSVEPPVLPSVRPRPRVRRMFARLAMFVLAFAAGALVFGLAADDDKASVRDTSPTEPPAQPSPGPIESPIEPAEPPDRHPEPAELPAPVIETTTEPQPVPQRRQRSHADHHRIIPEQAGAQPAQTDDPGSWMPGIDTKRAPERNQAP